MDTDAKGQLGGMDASADVRRRLASQSRAWRCGVCGKSNEGIMREVEAEIKAKGEVEKKEEEVVPEGLTLAYREELSGGAEKMGAENNGMPPEPVASATAVDGAQPVQPGAAEETQLPRAAQQPPPLPGNQVQRPNQDVPAWIDKAIYGIVAALLFLVWKKLGS